MQIPTKISLHVISDVSGSSTDSRRAKVHSSVVIPRAMESPPSGIQNAMKPTKFSKMAGIIKRAHVLNVRRSNSMVK